MTDAATPAADAAAMQSNLAGAAKPIAFTFGDPEPVLSRRDLLESIECWSNGRWFEPPINLGGLAKAFTASPHHSSAMLLKRNLLTSSFVPHPRLAAKEFGAFAQDYLVFGMGYLEQRRNMLNKPLRYERAMAKFCRRGVGSADEFFYLTHGDAWAPMIGGMDVAHPFEPGTVFQLAAPSNDQEIYGVPEYISALQSVFLNEGATIFRRRYYANGSHAGFILYMTDAAQQETDIDTLRQALKDSKGPGNFRNIFVHSPNGKKDGLQVIPVSEVAAKDEFLGIKNTSRDDILAAHRVPPQLLGVVPQNTGGFGDVAKAADVFHRLEIEPLQTKFLEVNDWAGEELIRFKPYVPLATPAPTAA